MSPLRRLRYASGMTTVRKQDFPLHQLRQHLEPSPTVLVTSRSGHETNIMTMNWYTVMEFSPALIGCVIAGGNHSFSLIKTSKQCVINIPTVDLIDTVVGIGNSDGQSIDKFKEFGLTEDKASKVKAPLIRECYANIECKLVDSKFVDKYNFFVFEAVRAHIRPRPRFPKTIHYRGEGIFMVDGEHLSRKRLFRDVNL